MNNRDYQKYPIPSRSCAILRTSRRRSGLLGDEQSLKQVADMLDIRPRTISKIEKELAPFAPFGLVAALALNYGIDLEDLTHDKWKQTNLEKSDARLGHALHKFRNLLTSEQRSAVINQIELFAMENKKAGAIVDYFALPKNVGN